MIPLRAAAVLLALWTGPVLADAGLVRLPYQDPAHGRPARMVVWYPTDASAAPQRMGPFTMTVAPGAEPRPGRHPLVVISHGSGGSELGHGDTAAALAERGFVVVALQHPGNSYDDNGEARRPAMWRNRPRQFSAALDAVLAHPRLGPLVDGGRIGAIGFSAGAYTVLVAAGGVADLSGISEHCARHPDDSFCSQSEVSGTDPAESAAARTGAVAARDPRVRAVVVMAPPAAPFGEGALAGVTVPVRLYGGAADTVVPPRHHAERIRDLLPAPPEWELVANAGHFAFMTPFPAALAAEIGPPAEDPPGFDRTAFHRRLNDEVADFFERTLAVSP
ncbi:alpha/beta hydrolase family protein [Azospirillum sp. ST 5-10]|uniref:alpha/beta hydrolase family protein n=1 Tax=unclassified Azospirillum TaxID=2630922 RepID=UPI003F4A0F51